MQLAPSADALILTYHAVDDGGAPLAIDPRLFREHVARIADSGRPVVTISELAERLRAHKPEGAVAITFDDGFESVFAEALPLLAERELPATIFCVGAYVGEANDWPSDRGRGGARRLADAAELAKAQEQGFEIGSHGLTHAPLVSDDEELIWHELEGSRQALELVSGGAVRSFAFPYGASSPTARAVARAIYAAVCTTDARTVRADDSPHWLPRVDAHYLRQPSLLARALDGSLGVYLSARRFGARARRRIVQDYLPTGART